MVAFKDLHAEQCRSEENKIDHYTGCKNMDLRWILVVVKASCSWNPRESSNMKEVDASTALLGPVPLQWVSGPFIVDGKLHASATSDHIKTEKKYLQ
jgi:hypothetical protein